MSQSDDEVALKTQGGDDGDKGTSTDEGPEEGATAEHEEPGELGASEGPAPRKRQLRQGQGGTEESYIPVDDERAMTALEFVMDVIDHMGMDCSVILRRPKEDDSAEIRIEISGPDSGRVIGKKGQVLSALQFLTNRAINRPGTEKRHILVDAEGYRSRREDQLAEMAVRLAKQAAEAGKIITFEPMNPRDRRVVHLALLDMEGVVTRSDGEGDERRVQIIPVRH